MKLEALSLEQCEKVRIWRNSEMECWRTPFMLTKEMQKAFYYDIPCNRKKNHRYWAIIDEEAKGYKKSRPNIYTRAEIECAGFIGMGGITYIQWENRIGEITLIIDPEKRKDGLGEEAVDLLLDQAFNYLNLQTVFGEVYLCNNATKFWKDITDKYKGYMTSLPGRKYWQGIYFNSWYFSINKNDFNKIHNSQ